MANENTKRIRELKQDIQDLLKNSEYLKEEFGAAVNELKQGKAPLKEWEEQFKKINRASEDMKMSTGELVQNLTSILDASSKQANLQGRINRGMGSMASMAQKIQSYEAGIADLSEKELKSLSSKLKGEKLKLQNNVKALQNKKEEEGLSDSEEKTLRASTDLLTEKGGQLDTLNDKIQNSLEIQKKINNNYGLGAGLLEGMAGVLDKMGMGKLSQSLGLEEAKQKMQETAKGIENGGEKAGLLGAKFTVLSEGIKVMGTNLIKSLGPLAIAMKLFDGMMQADKSTGELAHNLGMSFSEADKMRESFIDIDNKAHNTNISIKGLQESQLAVGKALGSNAQLNEKDLATMTEMTTAMGITHDEIMGIQKLSLVNGKTLEQNTKEAMGGAKAYAMSKGLVMDQQQILKEVSKASASLKLSLGQSTEALGESVAKAKEFGLSLEDAQEIANSLLDFESSIQSELEAELLTGKNLNFEKARQLALEGDIAGAAAEVAKQVGSAAEFGKMNVIQQEAIAKSMGLNREQLAQSLIEREALAAIGAEEGANLQEEYEKMKARGMSEAEIREKIGNDELARQLEQQSNQEHMQQAMLEMQEIVIQIGQAMMPFFEMLTNIAEFILPTIKEAFIGLQGILEGNFSKLSDSQKVLGIIATTIGTIIVAYKTYKGLQKAVLFIEKAQLAWAKLRGKELQKQKSQEIASSSRGIVGGAWKSLGSIPIIGAGLAVAAIATALAMLNSFGDDVYSKPGYGKRTLMGPEGAIQLNDKDTVIAGTNLFGDDVKSTGEGTKMSSKGSLGVDMSPVVSAINALGAKIDKLGNVTVKVDGAAIASTAVNNAEFDRSISNKTRELQ